MKNFILSGISILITLVIAEFALHFFHPIEYLKPLTEEEKLTWETSIYMDSDIDGLDYEHKPSMDIVYEGINYTTDQFGMRHSSPSKTKQKESFRIAAVGDSYTYGYGIDIEDAYTMQLQEKLNQDSTSVYYEVLNFGVISYSSVDYAAVVNHKIDDWDVDLIIILHVMNDAQTDANIFTHSYTKRHWYHNFNIGRLISKGIKNLRRPQSSHKGYFEQNYDVNAQNWWDVQKAFRDIDMKADQMKVPVVFVLFPAILWEEEWSNSEYMSGFYDQVLTEAQLNSFDLIIDLNDVLTKYKPVDLRVSEFDEHPSKFANELFSSHLLERLQENGLLNSKD